MVSENIIILAIDDNKDNLVVLKAMIADSFPDSNFLSADGGEEGISMAKEFCPDVILLDILMPGLDGFQTCRIIKEDNSINYIPIVFMTALKTSTESRVKALEAGAEGFLSKPVDEIELIVQIKAMVKVKKANEVIRHEKEHLEMLVMERTRELSVREEKLIQSYKKIESTLDSAIMTISSICEVRDPYTAGHQVKVAQLACAIAEEMGLSDDTIKNLKTAAILHDIGKINIPASILAKPGKLNDIEFAMIKSHSQTGYDIIKTMDMPSSIATMILQHHERIDGSGFPNGLKDSDILLESKILVVSDVAEAMTSHRPYRPALGTDAALEEISKNRGILYDPGVSDSCLKIFYKKGFKFL
jgi:putative two-component system response regulator